MLYENEIKELGRMGTCYECWTNGDDYHRDENGELVSNCPKCPYRCAVVYD